MSKSHWMSIYELSRKYDIPIQTLETWCKEGTIPAKRQSTNKKGPKSGWYVNLHELKQLAEIRFHFEQETGSVYEYLDETGQVIEGISIVYDPGFGGDGIEIARSRKNKK